MKDILITGVEGFVGGHLVRRLLQEEKDASITGAYFNEPQKGLSEKIQLIKADLTSKEDVEYLFNEKMTYDVIYHLAGLSNVGYSWEHPDEAFKVNVIGTLFLLEAIRQSGKKTKLLFVSSSEVYGAGFEGVVDEGVNPNPESPYAISKLSSEHLALLYGKVYGFPVYIVRPVPHTGPGQSKNFAIMNFCLQAIMLKKESSASPVIKVGNIDLIKDYCDVRDVVEAYMLLIRKMPDSSIYNISTENKVTLRDILEIIQNELKFKFNIEKDTSRIRPHDPDLPIISNKKIKSLGWIPQYSIEETIRDMIISLQK